MFIQIVTPPSSRRWNSSARIGRRREGDTWPGAEYGRDHNNPTTIQRVSRSTPRVACTDSNHRTPRNRRMMASPTAPRHSTTSTSSTTSH